MGTTAITFSVYTSASLPSQTGQSGKFLTTDGTTPSWVAPTGAAAGTYTTATVVVDSAGKITSISTGASGGAQLYDALMLMGA
jgi:hypothetical protein